MSTTIAEIGSLGRISYQQITNLDVTDEYYEYQIRLENTQKSRKRYLELLEQATTVEEILQIEKELERLNEKIDLMKGRMNRIDHLSDYSTISITIERKKKPGIFGYVFVGLYKSVRWLFIRGTD